MREIFLVAVGGAFGSVLRLKLGGLVLQHSVNSKFPLSTFSVNVLGCLLIGLCAGFLSRHEGYGAAWRALVLTGILGGFTTFSAFGLETTHLLRENHWGIALSYVLLSVIVGIGAVFLGFWTFRNFP